MDDDMDPVMEEFFNGPIIVDEWYGRTNSYPILIIGTQSMGGYIDKGAGEGGWQPAKGGDIEIKSNELMGVFNKKLDSMDLDGISSLNGNVAVCNVFDKQLVNIPLNVAPGDYKCDQPFGDTTSGEETRDVILSKIINNSRWIYDKLREGKHVLIHCNAGASRSPTVVVKMLTDTLGKSVDEAIKLVKNNAPKMDDDDRVKIGKFRVLLLEGAGASRVSASGEPRARTPPPLPRSKTPLRKPKGAGASRAVVDLEPDMGGFGAAQATQQDLKREEIEKILRKIEEKNLTIESLGSEGLDFSRIQADVDKLTTRLEQLTHDGGGKKKKRKSKKKKSKKRKTKRKYKRR